MLWDKLIIKGNEIKEPGFFGKTIYVIKGNEIKEPGFFGKTVFVIKGNEIREPGFFGKTVYVIKGDEIRTPGWFGTTVAKQKNDGSIRYNKPQPPTDKNPTVGKSTFSDSSSGYSFKTHVEIDDEPEETLDELRERLDKEQGCVIDYTNCAPDKKIYSIPKRYKKLTAIAPALRLDSVKIHAEVALIITKNIRAWKEFIVDEGNQYYASSGGVLFDKKMEILYRVPLGENFIEYHIPDGIKKINEYAFYFTVCEKIIIPSTVTTIGENAFAYNKKIKEIYIPCSVEKLAKSAFDGCSARLQICTAHKAKPSGWEIDETSLKKAIVWDKK